LYPYTMWEITSWNVCPNTFFFRGLEKKAYEKQKYGLTIYYNVDQSPHERFEKSKGFP
jgi:hypothetical protein